MLLLNRRHQKHVSRADTLPFQANLITTPSCDVVTRTFRHLLWTRKDGSMLDAPAEVVVRTRTERTGGEYILGDLVYTLSLLPGEEVRIFTTDRRARFSVDATTKIGYQTSATFEDHMYLSSMDSFFGRLSASQWAHADAGTSGSFSAHGETSNVFESLFSNPDADMNGSFNVNSFADFIGGMSAQASAAHQMSATATNTASAVSVGAIGVRQSIEGSLDTHVEMNYRHFRNPSRTRAVTFYFFQIRRMHRVRFWVESLSVSAPERTMWRLRPPGNTARSPNLPPNVDSYAQYRAAHALVTQELIDKQLLVPHGSGHVMPESVRAQTTFEHEFSLPTPGLCVRGARDKGVVADPSLFREVSEVGGLIADKVEGVALSFIERLGDGIVPAVVNGVVGVQALLSGATASLP